ncbi:glycoside hydrolase family 127 protein [Ramaria rubella]|nr:glycoside hydrolase family 127 protein [Ramaria rubella]
MSFLTDSRSVAFNRVRITSEFWQARVRASKEGALPTMWKRMKETGRWDVLRLEWKEGMPNRPHHFWDSDVAKWTEAACYALTPTVNSDGSQVEEINDNTSIFLASKVAEAVALISGAQWKDGYINSYFTVVEPGKRWTNVAWYHELYCAGHLLEAAIAHAIYSASRTSCDERTNSLLEPLLKYVSHIDETFGPDEETGQRRGYPGHQELELALLRLYDHLGVTSQSQIQANMEIQKRVLALASFFIKERGQLRNGLHFYDYEATLRNNDPPAKPGPSYPTAPRWSYNQADAPISHIQTVEGHSVRAGYWLTAVAHLARLTGDEGLLHDAQRLWDNMTERKMHITGGMGAIGDWEGFGPDYYLPNESAYAETCASVALIFFAHQMLLINPLDVRFGDVLERALYNGALVGMSMDGQTFFYDNPLATVGKWRERTAWFEVKTQLPGSTFMLNYPRLPLGFVLSPQSCPSSYILRKVHLHAEYIRWPGNYSHPPAYWL